MIQQLDLSPTAMCVNYRPPHPELLDAVLGAVVELYRDWEWPAETWKDYLAPIVKAAPDRQRELRLASYGMVPRRHIPPGVRVFDTMNARAETIGEKRSFASAWRKSQLCAIPMHHFYEPCYESGRPIRYAIGMHDDALFFVAGLWREWGQADGSVHTSFTQITINADEHPLMRRFHKPGDEKRALVVLPSDDVDSWLACNDPEVARSFLQHYPADRMKAYPSPLPPRQKKTSTQDTGSLI